MRTIYHDGRADQALESVARIGVADTLLLGEISSVKYKYLADYRLVMATV